MKLTKTVVTGSVLALAFLANCDLILGPSWEYGEAEMRSAVEGTWKLTRHGEDITLVAKQSTSAKQSARERGLVKSAAACGSRSFIKQAAACGDVSRMPLELVAEGHEVTDAELMVGSVTFTRGELRFQLDGASVNAAIDPNGVVSEATIYVTPSDPNQPYKQETVTLKRVAK